MLIPIRTDYRLTRTPIVNYLLLGANIALFVLGYHGVTNESIRRIEPFLLDNNHPQVYQFFSSMFLHANLSHLIGNMVFLWVFGNAINDKFGNVGYLGFYLAGGVFAGLGYLLTTPAAPVLGASGAISAVTGAYIVLLPRVRVTLLVFFFFITFVEASSLVFLLFQFVFNMAFTFDAITKPGGGGVAYSAHAAGYVFGIGIAAFLLLSRLLPRDAYDLLNLIKSRHRRSKYRRMVSQGYDPFQYTSVQKAKSRKVRARQVDSKPADAPEQRVAKLRRQIAQEVAAHNLPEASRMYLQLIQLEDDVVLPRHEQLDVANQLMSQQQYPPAADAYERFLKHYGQDNDAPDIHLMLGLLYGRYLHQYDAAKDHLTAAIENLHDDRKKQMARSELDQLG
jgi:membrane associated rhomboid family serine protease